MKDLNSILLAAKNKKMFHDNSELNELINSLLHIDNTLCLDWDRGAGEEWIRLFRRDSGMICMLHSKIGIAFVRFQETDGLLMKELEHLYLVEVDDYSSNEWKIDLTMLLKFIPEISWNVSQYSVDTEKMSLYDLYFATV